MGLTNENLALTPGCGKYVWSILLCFQNCDLAAAAARAAFGADDMLLWCGLSEIDSEDWQWRDSFYVL